MPVFAKYDGVDGEALRQEIDLITERNSKSNIKLDERDADLLSALSLLPDFSDEFYFEIGILDFDVGNKRVLDKGPSDALKYIKFDGLDGESDLADELLQISLNFEEIKLVQTKDTTMFLFNEGRAAGPFDSGIVGTDLTIVDDFMF